MLCSEVKLQGSYFQLALFGEWTDPIQTDFEMSEIKQAIEKLSSVGNVTVWFPNAGNDKIETACNATLNSTAGGFFVRFDTEFGDLPLMQARGPIKQKVRVYEVQRGVNVSVVLQESLKSAQACLFFSESFRMQWYESWILHGRR